MATLRTCTALKLSHDGIYEADVDGGDRLVDGNARAWGVTETSGG